MACRNEKAWTEGCLSIGKVGEGIWWLGLDDGGLQSLFPTGEFPLNRCCASRLSTSSSALAAGNTTTWSKSSLSFSGPVAATIISLAMFRLFGRLAAKAFPRAGLPIFGSSCTSRRAYILQAPYTGLPSHEMRSL